ncbi:hydrogenase maturation nickel metallochaperone HypA [Heliophilum fasciatum]|uniref:Hydrogenase maturation factor HypA n=1 Tax=Heliophilum fasciatum TaxID=35700 RepID=A0A4R2RGU2_9FIRM|nr:hydrogenase maturation nickel metallochaperone HypA [Heliophilum fasciatum]MCW2278950.1 hydrogenase nickel incorporation protein HypA/HybF [Heliophilum fasciatum]TCP61798.1 hydrogenase-3 nickel incorporation protein HypA [Heliophilum fasciatum]
MHEMALMESLTEVLRRECAQRQVGPVTKVKLVVGALTHAMPDALRFAFEVCRSAPPYAPAAELEIEEVPTEGSCRDCQERFPVAAGEWIFLCPRCGSGAVTIVQGRELRIDYFETADGNG